MRPSATAPWFAGLLLFTAFVCAPVLPPGRATASTPPVEVARVQLPLRTVYTPAVLPGMTRVVRTIRTVRDGGRAVVTTTVTRYRHTVESLPACQIRIPALGLRKRIVEGVSQAAMSRGPGHFPGMALPGEVGNCGLAAHSNVPGCAYFQGLHRLHIGDSILLDTPNGTYNYLVTDLHVVRPTQTFDLRPTSYRRLTLVTCTLPDARRRLIVVAITPTNDGAAFNSPVPQSAMPVAGRSTRAHRRHDFSRRIRQGSR